MNKAKFVTLVFFIIVASTCFFWIWILKPKHTSLKSLSDIYVPKPKFETKSEVYYGIIYFSRIQSIYEETVRIIDRRSRTYEKIVDSQDVDAKLNKIKLHLDIICEYVENLPDEFGHFNGNYLENPFLKKRIKKIDMFNLETFDPSHRPISLNQTLSHEVNLALVTIVNHLESNIAKLFEFLRKLDDEVKTAKKSWNATDFPTFYDSIICETFLDPKEWCDYGVRKKNHGTTLEFLIYTGRYHGLKEFTKEDLLRKINTKELDINDTCISAASINKPDIFLCNIPKN